MKPNMTLGRCTIFTLDLAEGGLRLIWSMRATRSQDTHFLRLMNLVGSTTLFSVLKWRRAYFGRYPHSAGGLEHEFAGPLVLMYARTDYELRPFLCQRSKLSVEWFIKAIEKYRVDRETLESYIHRAVKMTVAGPMSREMQQQTVSLNS